MICEAPYCKAEATRYLVRPKDHLATPDSRAYCYDCFAERFRKGMERHERVSGMAIRPKVASV